MIALYVIQIARERTHGRGRNIMMKVHDLSDISFPALVVRSTGVFARVKYTNVMSRNERRTRGTVSVNSRARYLAKNTTILSYSSPRTEVHGWLSRCLQKKKNDFRVAYSDMADAHGAWMHTVHAQDGRRRRTGTEEPSRNGERVPACVRVRVRSCTCAAADICPLPPPLSPVADNDPARLILLLLLIHRLLTAATTISAHQNHRPSSYCACVCVCVCVCYVRVYICVCVNSILSPLNLS